MLDIYKSNIYAFCFLFNRNQCFCSRIPKNHTFTDIFTLCIFIACKIC